MNERAALVAAWDACDAEAVRRLLQGKCVWEHRYLLEMGYDIIRGFGETFRVFPYCLRVFMEAADAQNMDLIELQKIAYVCERLAEMCLPSSGGPVMREARALAWRAKDIYPRYERRCRETLTALLGCVGKPKRVYGGALRDVVRAVARTVWATQRRSEKWFVRQPPRINSVPVRFVLLNNDE